MLNSSETKHMKAKGRYIKAICTCLCCLIIGFLLGVALDAKYRPNHILLYINADSKVSISPRPGDIISWATKDDPYGKKITINYTAGLAPCKANTGIQTPCIFEPLDGGPDLYLFGCTLSADPKTCFDPQYGPKCTGCGQGTNYTSFPPLTFHDFWNTLGWDIARLINPVPTLRKAPQNLAGLGITSVNSTNAVPLTSPSSLVEVAALCNGNTPAVFLGGSSSVITHIPARALDTITWNAYNSYSITNLNICSQGSMPSSPGANQSCTVKSDTPVSSVPYTLNMTCNNAASSAQEYIDVVGSSLSPKSANAR